MAMSQEQIKSSYPLPAYNYRVTILLGNAVGVFDDSDLSSATVISCSKVSGLNMEIDTVTYKHGFSFVMGAHIIPAQKKEVNLTIIKGVTSNNDYFAQWMKKVYPGSFGSPIDYARKRDLLIDLLDESGQPIVRWTVLKAFPVKLQAPTFDANTNEVAFDEMEFIAHELKVEYMNLT